MHQEDIGPSHFFERAAPRDNITTTIVGAATATEEEAGTICTEATTTATTVSEKKLPEKEPAPAMKRQRTLRVEIDSVRTPEIVYAYTNLPVLSILPELQHFYPSITVAQL